MSVNLGSAVGYLELDSSRWTSSYNTARQQMQTLADSSQSMSTRFQTAGQMLTSAGSTLTTHVTAPLLALGGAATSMSMQAETSMAKVNSILQLSSSEWTKYQTTLEQGANDIGMAYSDYAEAAYSAISAGVKQADVTNFLTQSNKLAKGGLTDLATATDLLTTVQNAYGLSQKDMQHVSDVLIQTQNKGKTTVGELGSAMGRVIPTANSLGVSVEQLGASYAIMTAGGINTAESTTYLNSMLNELGKSGSGVDKILREQTGKSFKELMESGKSTGDVLQILSDYAEKSGKSLTDLFSSAEAGKAATALMKDGVSSFNEQLDGMINSTGACDKAFKTMNSTAKEQLTQSINKLKNAMVEIGDVMLPVVANIAQVVAGFADFLNQLGQANPALLQTTVVIGGIVAAIGPLLLILGSLASAIGNILELKALISEAGIITSVISKISGVFTSLGAIITGTVIPAIQSLWAFMLANPITFVIAAIAALVAGFIYLWNNCESFRNFWINLWDNIVETVQNIPTYFENALNAIGDTFNSIKETITTKLSETWQSITTWCSDTYNSFIEWGTNLITNIGNWFNELPSRIGYALGFALGTIASWIVNTWNYFTTNIPKWIESIGQWFSELPGKIGTWLTNTYNNVISWGSNMLSKAIETGTNFVNNVVNFIKNLPTTVYNWLTQTYNKVVNWATQMINKAREVGSNFVSKVGSTIQSLPGKVWSYLSQTISKAVTFVSQFGQKATQAARNFTTNIVNGVRNIPNQMLSIGRNIVQGIWRGISGAAGWLRSQISNFASGIINGFKSAFKINSPSKIMRDIIGKGIVEGIGVGIDQEEDSLLTKAYKLAGNVVNVMDGNIATANLFDSAKNLTTSMGIATNQATGQDSRANNINVAFNINNPTFSDKIDIESFMDEASYEFANLKELIIPSDRKSTRLNSSHVRTSRMPSSA